MKLLMFSLIIILGISSIGFAKGQGQGQQPIVTCVLYQSENLVVITAVEQFTTTPEYCDGHSKTIDIFLGLGYHTAGANQFEVFMTK